MSSLAELLLQGFPIKPSFPPTVQGNTFEIRLTADELKQLLFSRVDPQTRARVESLIIIEIHEGYISFKLRLA